MCTLILFHRVWPGYPWVVASNRDEALDRPAEGARWRPSNPTSTSFGAKDHGPIFAPRDLQAGGTWMGATKAGLFVGLTNRFSTITAAPRSRGELVAYGLGESRAYEAVQRVRGLDLSQYAGFHFVAADETAAFRCIWDPAEAAPMIMELTPGPHIVTERSFGAAPSGREDYLKPKVAALLDATSPDWEAMKGILRHQDSSGFDSVCVELPDRNYGTRSSALVAFDGQALQWAQADGPPCRTEFEPLLGFGP